MKISIITATYNSAATIRDTLESVLNQTYKDIEYWIIDGASADGTMDIVCGYEEAFGGRLHWISEPDKGIYDAMNKGIERATGDVVGILNSDDFFTSNDVLAVVAETFNNEKEIDAMYGDIHFVKPDNLKKCVRYYSSKMFRPWLIRWGYMPAHPSFYCKKGIYDKYGLYSLDYKICSDFDMMVRLLYKYRIKTKYVSKDFVTMRTGGISTSKFSHRMLITKEDAIACRRNGLYSNFLMCSSKYFTKVFEFI